MVLEDPILWQIILVVTLGIQKLKMCLLRVVHFGIYICSTEESGKNIHEDAIIKYL